MITLQDLNTDELHQLLEYFLQDYDDVCLYKEELTTTIESGGEVPDREDVVQGFHEEVERTKEVLRILETTPGVRKDVLHMQRSIVKDLSTLGERTEDPTIYTNQVELLISDYQMATSLHSIRLLEARMAEVNLELKKREG